MLFWNLRKKQWKMSVAATSFSNDENAHPPALLKTKSTRNILIHRVHKFHRSYFKEHLWNAATVLQKVYCLKACYEVCFWYHLSKSTSIEAHQNTECINLCIHFPKFRLVRCFLLHRAMYKALNKRSYWLIGMNIRKTLQASVFSFIA